MSGVLSVKRITTGLWVDVASLCGTSAKTGTSGGPTNLDGYWDGPLLERDAVAVAGEDRARRTDNARGTLRVWPLQLLLAADTPSEAYELLRGIKRHFPVGQIVELKMDDGSGVAFGSVDAIRPVSIPRVDTDDWSHGDRLVTIPITFHDPALYADADTYSVAANTPEKIDLLSLKSFWLFEGTAAGTVTLTAYRDDGTGLAPAADPYGILTINEASGDLVVDTRDGVDDAYIDGAEDHLWTSIEPGTWFFRLGEGRGEEHVWFKSTIAGTLTVSPRD